MMDCQSSIPRKPGYIFINWCDDPGTRVAILNDNTPPIAIPAGMNLDPFWADKLVNIPLPKDHWHASGPGPDDEAEVE